MKSQDVLLLVKLICLGNLKVDDIVTNNTSSNLVGWLDESELDTELNHIDAIFESSDSYERLFTLRGLSEELGISKSEISKSLKRCIDVKLAKINRLTGRPEANKRAFDEFITHGFKYVFPVKSAQVTRGIPTTFSAPVLQSKLLSGGDLKMVWPDPRGKDMGQAIEPLYKSVPLAVRRDSEVYAYLALLDAIRIGNARESNLAIKMFKERLFQ
ncbi:MULTISPECIES: hypothetical protein [Vibrio]|uniref:Uncharacterized protein n=3 Tax=Vibrio TaxID=662 RepID=A0A2N7C938_VIBSP|nr:MULTISPECIES: hypothetical protein [Vibrio]MBT2975953.1 hypothetical protein [Vibrio anguillarum]MBT2984005.1 hypothetical protein [Vibrio anguillarum]PMF17663.1 hypothetical protein BCV19_18165 [Vibrio splendidus]PTP66346.1 hypothetical protein CWO31_11010 [Vibrio splendidus]PTP97241.1 hypothetical protein CWO28_20940 [Vibrio splendidus]